MQYLRSGFRSSFLLSFIAVLLSILTFAQDQPSSTTQTGSDSARTNSQDNITIPAGTHLAMVLTQPVETRYIHRGDDIYAQVTSPVDAENEVVIPPGTFVQGTVDKIGRNGGRGELRLESMSITFPDGYVTPIAGPIVLETTEGYAIKDPGSKRGGAAIAMPFVGLGLGALIGRSAGKSSSTVTSNFPPGCVPPEFGCTPISTEVMGTRGKDTAIGASIGGAAGMFAALFMLTSSHHFYLDAGAPVQMTLQQAVTLPENEVAKAVHQSEEHSVAIQPVEPRPLPASPLDTTFDHGTCYTPGSSGTPDTVIPGVPGPDGNIGPPTIIPGTPPSPGIPYPCP